MPSGVPRGSMTMHAEQAVAEHSEFKGSAYAAPEQQAAGTAGDKANIAVGGFGCGSFC